MFFLNWSCKIESSLLEDNQIQLSVYQKNWRYGGSGNIEINNSKIQALENKLTSDKKGAISISSSNIVGKIKKSKKSRFKKFEKL